MAKRPQAAIFRGLAGRKLATDDVLHAGGSEVGTEGDGAPVAAGDYTPPPAPVPTSEPPAPEPPAPEPGQVEGDRPSRRRRDPPGPELPFLYTSATIARRGGHAS